MATTAKRSRSAPALRSKVGATIRDVAARAGVSVATVSRTLNGVGPVRDATSRHVLKIAQAVNDLAPSGRRKSYRHAHALAVDCSTVLDIVARRSDVDRTVVNAAQKLLSELLSNLDHLRTQSV